MAPSKKSAKTESTAVAEAAPAPVAKKAESKKSDSKKVEKPVVEKKPVEAKKAPSKKAEVKPVEEQAEEQKPKGRRTVTKESVDADFTSLIEKVQAEIERLQASNDKVKGVKFLKTINKTIKTLHIDAVRMMKLKKNINRKEGSTSGFNMPIMISKDMAKFIGGDVNSQYNRVEITKKICAYIKDHNLQNPADRRQINADAKLRDLLKVDPKAAEPLTYFRLQQYLTSHFIAIPKPESAAAPAKK